MRDIKSLKLAIEKELFKPLETLSIISLVDLLVEYSYIARASDIHLEPAPKTLRARFRIDGILIDIFENISISKEIHSEVITRIKVLAGLRTDEHNRPQDGRFKIRLESFPEGIDVRVSIVPTYHGENAILRILAQTSDFNLETLGFSQDGLNRVKKAIQKPYGMILANGPTGSGKSTTLYTILKILNAPAVSVITIEDPIEYSIEGATQIQVNNEVGVTFAGGLRAVLRQDPNIIMVGEIRDQETAQIAVNAALTGHLLLSTLHTNDAATTFPRLSDMGIPPFLVASTVNIVMGQRLIRRVCKHCTTQRTIEDIELKSLFEIAPELKDIEIKTVPQIKGCAECGNTGYQDRIGIREVLEVSDKIRELIMSRANADQIKRAAVEDGMRTMLQDGFEKAAQGITTVEEVLRIIHE